MGLVTNPMLTLRPFLGSVVAFVVLAAPPLVRAQDLTVTPIEWLEPNDAPDTLPHFLRNPQPSSVPEGLREADGPAYIEYRWTLDDDGTHVGIGTFATHPLLRDVNNERVNGGVLSPARRNGKAVASEVRLYVIFNPKAASKRGSEAIPRLLRVVSAELPATHSSGNPGPQVLTVEVDVDETGKVTRVYPKFEAPPDVTNAARLAARRFQFAPARHDGEPTAARIEVPVILVPGRDPTASRNYTPPKAIKQSRAQYPFDLLRSGFGGEVLVQFEVTVEGRTRNVYALRSQHPSFDEAAVDAVEQWRFKPATVDGKPVNTRMRVTMMFSVEGLDTKPWTIERPKKFSDQLPVAFHWETAPELIGYNPPVYPRQALAEKKEGTVNIAFVIDPFGNVIEATGVGDSDPELQAAAIAAVTSFTFKPASQKGDSCFAMVAMEFRFNTSGRGEVPVSRDDRRLVKILAESPSELVDLGQLDAPPKPIARKPPQAPPELRKTGGKGEAMIEFIIDRKGFARLPKVIEATSPEMGYAACQAVATWRFEAPRRDEQPVDALVRIPVVISIN